MILPANRDTQKKQKTYCHVMVVAVIVFMIITIEKIHNMSNYNNYAREKPSKYRHARPKCLLDSYRLSTHVIKRFSDFVNTVTYIIVSTMVFSYSMFWFV